MNGDTFGLIEKICQFLQENDYVRLTKILERTQRVTEEFYPLVGGFKKRTLFQRLGEIRSESTACGFPFGLMGAKAEKDEMKAKIREDRMILALQLKNTIRTSSLSERETRFLEILYQVIF